MIDGLHRRMTHFLALAAAGGRLVLRLLAVMLPETDIHVALNVGDVGQNVVDHAHLDGPTEEIQLADGGLFDGSLAANLEADALAAAERIEEPLGIGLEFALVVKMHHKLAGGVGGCIGKWIAHVELFGIVGHEPVDETEAHGRLAGQDGEHLGEPSRLIVEVLEPTDDEILFALDAILEGLTGIGCCGCGRVHLLGIWSLVGLDGRRDSVVIVEVCLGHLTLRLQQNY